VRPRSATRRGVQLGSILLRGEWWRGFRRLRDKFERLNRLVQWAREGLRLYDEVTKFCPEILRAGRRTRRRAGRPGYRRHRNSGRAKDSEKKTEEGEGGELVSLDLPSASARRSTTPVRSTCGRWHGPAADARGLGRNRRRVERGQTRPQSARARPPDDPGDRGLGEEAARIRLGARHRPDSRSHPDRRTVRRSARNSASGGGHRAAVQKDPQCRQKTSGDSRGMKPKQYRRQLWSWGG